MSELFSEESKKKFISEVGYGSSREIWIMLTICKYCTPLVSYCNMTDDSSVYFLESESNKMLCLYGHLQKHYNSYNLDDWKLFRSLECPWVSYFLRKNYGEWVPTFGRLYCIKSGVSIKNRYATLVTYLIQIRVGLSSLLYL